MRTIHFSKKFYSSIKTVGATVLGGLWALEWAWHIAETNLRCVRSSGICRPNLNSQISCCWDGPKSTAQSKVWCVPSFPFAHGTLPLPLKSPLSPTSRSSNSLSPNSHLRHAVTTPQFTAYLVDGRPPCKIAAAICGELFNSSHPSKSKTNF